MKEVKMVEIDLIEDGHRFGIVTEEEMNFINREISTVRAGDEGLIFKNLNSTYYDRHGMKKAKKFQRWTMIICGFKKGNGKYKGAVGSVGVKFYGEELLTYASGLSDELRWSMAKNPEKYIGKIIEVEAMGFTKTGSLRHPRMMDFRLDKTTEDCIREQNSPIQ